jgi:hypothetical protein
MRRDFPGDAGRLAGVPRPSLGEEKNQGGFDARGSGIPVSGSASAARAGRTGKSLEAGFRIRRSEAAAIAARMMRDVIPGVSPGIRAWCYLRLAYTELQYWLVGLTPEGYHLRQAGVWVEMHAYRQAIGHMRAYLANTENATARWYLAYYYSCVEEWAQAALEYEKVVVVLRQPVVRLGQAEAELRLGNRARAREILDGIDREFPQLDDALREARDELCSELSQEASKTIV